MTNRLWTNRVKLSSSNDINSLVPCLAVKGTNLMISQGLGRADESARWFKCWCFTGAVGHREACCGWPVQAVWQKATGLQSPAWGRCFTSVIQWGANVWEISQLRLKIQLELMHLNAGKWVDHNVSICCQLDVDLRKVEILKWTEEILDRNHEQVIAQISTTIQDNGPFCHTEV